MLENIVLPQIIGTGVFDAAINFRGIKETKERNVTFFEIDFPSEPGGFSFINGKKLPISENMLICAKPGSHRHTITPYRCYYLHLSVKSGEIFDCLSRCPDAFTPKNADEIKQVFLNIIRAYNFPDEKSNFCLAENILKLCSLINSEVGNLLLADNLKKRIGKPELIEQAVAFISENFGDNLSLEKIASYVNLSPTYFQKLFLKAVGKTPNEYILELRIRHAKEQLLTTDLPISFIAAECGFSSQSYFNYAFRRAEKMTPKNYRSIKNNEYHSGSTENAEFQYSSV